MKSTPGGLETDYKCYQVLVVIWESGIEVELLSEVDGVDGTALHRALLAFVPTQLFAHFIEQCDLETVEMWNLTLI